MDTPRLKSNTMGMTTGNSMAAIKRASAGLRKDTAEHEGWCDGIQKAPDVIRAAQLVDEEAEVTSRGALGRIPVRAGDRVVLLPLQKILWIQSKGDWVCLHSESADYDCRMTMTHLNRKLPGTFLRIHRNAIVNLLHVLEFVLPSSGNALVSLSNGKALPISRSGRSELRQYLLSCSCL
jgi:DNA-binding LytR/AlgR family response regulator